MKTLTTILIGVTVLAVASSCSTSGCSDNRSSIPLAGFYSSDDGKAISLDSVSVAGVGAPGDSLLLSVGKSSSEVYLPLRSDRETVTFIIRYMWRRAAELDMVDYITIGYESWPYFASEECGAMYRYRITGITHTDLLIDSVGVSAPDSIITNVNTQTLKIFFRTGQ